MRQTKRHRVDLPASRRMQEDRDTSPDIATEKNTSRHMDRLCDDTEQLRDRSTKLHDNVKLLRDTSMITATDDAASRRLGRLRGAASRIATPVFDFATVAVPLRRTVTRTRQPPRDCGGSPDFASNQRTSRQTDETLDTWWMIREDSFKSEAAGFGHFFARIQELVPAGGGTK